MNSNYAREWFVALCSFCVATQFSFAENNWTQTSAPAGTLWQEVACSADGTRIAAASHGGIYVSTNAGSTWIPSTMTIGQPWSSVASSADGVTMVAAVEGGLIYRSADGGSTWNPGNAPSNSWQRVACSGNGSRMAAVYGTQFSTGGIYLSVDGGITWTVSIPPTNGLGWYTIASSADGTRLAAMMVDALTPAGPYGLIYTSTNTGATWEQSTSIGWPCSLAGSADGTKWIAAQGEFGPIPGRILISTNSGATWAPGAFADAWSSVASSADGTLLTASIGGESSGPITGPIYISTNSGILWTADDSPTNDWISVASSADGDKLIAAVDGGGIYIGQTTPAPDINIGFSGTNLRLSWLIPSKNFVLQENGNLAATNWTNVPVVPMLNSTNLHYEVTVPPLDDSRFYRLAGQE
jgi:hypothetical protein